MVKKLSKKALAIVVLITALLLVGTITVLAAVYIWDRTPDENNVSTFVPSTVACSVSESEGVYSISTSGSNIPTYIRAAVVAYFADNSGNVYWQAPDISVDAEDKWELEGDGFYYYKGAVGADASVTFGTVTSSTEAPEGYTLTVNVLAENIQSEPAGAAQEAWGLIFNGSSWETP